MTVGRVNACDAQPSACSRASYSFLGAWLVLTTKKTQPTLVRQLIPTRFRDNFVEFRVVRVGFSQLVSI